MKKEYDICDEIRGYERFVEQILNICNDQVIRSIIFEAWLHFRDDQRKREDVICGWGLVETMNCNEDGHARVGLS